MRMSAGVPGLRLRKEICREGGYKKAGSAGKGRVRREQKSKKCEAAGI